jgi:hypothetical protein
MSTQLTLSSSICTLAFAMVAFFAAFDQNLAGETDTPIAVKSEIKPLDLTPLSLF